MEEKALREAGRKVDIVKKERGMLGGWGWVWGKGGEAHPDCPL